MERSHNVQVCLCTEIMLLTGGLYVSVSVFECCVHMCVLGRMYRGRSHTLEIYVLSGSRRMKHDGFGKLINAHFTLTWLNNISLRQAEAIQRFIYFSYNINLTLYFS